MRIITAEAIARVSPAYTLPETWITQSDELDLLINYQGLTDHPDQFLTSGFTAEDVFASRYYWFQQLVNLTERRYGYDPGMHQQALQILEHPHPVCDPNWEEFEAVYRLANGTASA